MKTKTTKKYINSHYDNVLSIGYCNLQHLLRLESPSYYTARREGWGADIYTTYDKENGFTAIVTGDSPFGKKVEYELQKEFDEKAQKELKANSDFETTQRILSDLLKEFVRKALA